ncbi:hypothetical protein EKE94_03900 [Mesobaculum littorinae]|uniref:Uncharacterized protein n=1 Tax=Mesobaculum littorinae TaxID=2486419 RepID=A0A438AMI0_9RHOB|nr:hypothetical protein [Mesobaculum littorinae]RVV99825.1 hypothetical protein EKE94_03900 [Mesobaculum littorinae]
MSELDPIRAPRNRRFLVSLCVAVFVIMGLLMGWSATDTAIGLATVGIVAGLIGFAVAQAVLRRGKRTKR